MKTLGDLTIVDPSCSCWIRKIVPKNERYGPRCLPLRIAPTTAVLSWRTLPSSDLWIVFPAASCTQLARIYSLPSIIISFADLTCARRTAESSRPNRRVRAVVGCSQKKPYTYCTRDTWLSSARQCDIIKNNSVLSARAAAGRQSRAIVTTIQVLQRSVRVVWTRRSNRERA